ncbi:Lipase 1 [Penicillium rolfsii]|nr:Lipase 1 [Penicillium rolfsii]
MRFSFLLTAAACATARAGTGVVGRDTTTDPEDFSWIKNWAAVGDSFTAGIGSGNVYSSQTSDRSCSRYDYSYPAIMNQFFGASVKNFTYSACSGAASVDIASQISGLSSGLDVAVMTAGGNDLCLTSIITKCILNSVTTESTCQNAITTAQTAIDGILQDNIVSLLTSLDGKMAKNGIIVLAGYAQYFNNETSDCTDNEDWVFPGQAGSTSLLLTTAHRTSFNSLVQNTNAKLQAAVTQAAKSASSTIVFADWDNWGDVTNGRFCESGASPDPTDPSNDNVLFFKLPTYKTLNPGTIYKRDYPWESTPILEMTGNITIGEEEKFERQEYAQLSDLVSRSLVKRDSPSAPACDKSALSGLLPDGIGKIFHPNNLGHEAMASYVTWAIALARASILGVTSPACTLVDEITCFQTQGAKGYASAYSLYANTQKFCQKVVPDMNTAGVGHQYSETFNSGTPDESIWTVTLGDGAVSLDETTCNAAVNRILDGCDGNDPKNPMNWKYGGKYVNSGFTYNITMTRINRPPAPTAPTSDCSGAYKAVLTRYHIRGAGWCNWDWGQQSLRPNSTHCFGLGLTGWSFNYFDQPDSDGYEWEAVFNSPIFTEARCYSNNKVQSAAGGPSDAGCH